MVDRAGQPEGASKVTRPHKSAASSLSSHPVSPSPTFREAQTPQADPNVGGTKGPILLSLLSCLTHQELACTAVTREHRFLAMIHKHSRSSQIALECLVLAYSSAAVGSADATMPADAARPSRSLVFKFGGQKVDVEERKTVDEQRSKIKLLQAARMLQSMTQAQLGSILEPV